MRKTLLKLATHHLVIISTHCLLMSLASIVKRIVKIYLQGNPEQDSFCDTAFRKVLRNATPQISTEKSTPGDPKISIGESNGVPLMDEILLHATFYLFLQTDGASACLIMSEDKALEMGFKPKAYLRYYEIKLKKCCYSIHFPVIYSLCPLLPLFSIGILYMSHRIPKISFYWGNFYISYYTELEFRILSFWTL